MAYATIADLQARMSRTIEQAETALCNALLADAAVIIDSTAPMAQLQAKKLVSCRMVLRILETEEAVPVGASQGSMSGLGYSQSWTIGSGGGAGELYLSKSDRQLLGKSNSIGSYSPVQDMTAGGDIWC